MSAAEDLRAALLAHAPLTAVVGQRVRQDFGLESDDYPFVVIRQTSDTPERSLDGTLLARSEAFQIESWGETRAQSHQVHKLVEAALIAAGEEADPADPDDTDPEVGARACIWNVLIWTT